MFGNYFKVAVRNFINQKYYSIINTVGLALGTAACILILLFVQDELSYEQDFINHEKIYRLVQDFPMGDHISKTASVPFPIKNTMIQDFPEIKDAVLIYSPGAWGNIPVIHYKDEEYFEDNYVYAEHSLLDIYNIKFVKGNRDEALKKPNELLITESVAEKYFGDEEPIGKLLNLGNFRDLEVIGVIEDLPSNTHLKFDLIASFETFKTFFNNPSFFDTQWVWVATWFYFTLEDEAAAEKISSQLDDFVQRHYPESLAGKGVKLHLQKADDVHLTSHRELEFQTNGNMSHVFLFSSVALLILLLAIINFMNLSTSRSAKRAKEVGLRKVMGAQKEMLIFQFIGEALLTSFLSLILAVGLIYLSLEWFNDITGKTITIELFTNTGLLAGLILLGGFIGILSGSYPAFVLSSHKPTGVLKGNTGSSSSSDLLRRVLVVTQFVVSISLIICIGIVYKQLKYIQNKDLGFDKEQILLVNVDFNRFNLLQGFKNELLQNPEIKSVALMGSSIPGNEEVIENSFVETGKPAEEQHWFSILNVSHDWEQIIDVEFLEGHSYQVGNSVDSTGYIINESAAKALGWTDDVVGKSLSGINTKNGNSNNTGEVIGLIKDFHYRPLYDPIKPLVIRLGGGSLAIKMQSGDLQSTVKTIREKWAVTFEGFPFRYTFMDDNYDVLYAKENKLSKTLRYFSILAIFIASLGLLGLSSYATESRRKEIGIRKVNGASTTKLLQLLTFDFTKLIVIAFIISVPIAYTFGTLWLNNFAYRTDIGVTIFVLAGLAALGIAIITVSYHTLRAALTNPVDSLRYSG